MCLCANFQFSWWSRHHFLAPFSGLYLPNAWSHTLQTSKRHTFRVSAFHWYHWFRVKLFHVDCAQDSWMLFGSGSAHATKFQNFSPPPWRFAAEIAAICRFYIGLRVRYKYYKKHSRSGLARSSWSQSKSAHKCIPYNNRFVNRLWIKATLTKVVVLKRAGLVKYPFRLLKQK